MLFVLFDLSRKREMEMEVALYKARSFEATTFLLVTKYWKL